MLRVPRPGHRFVRWSRARRAAIDFLDEGRRRNTVHGFGEVDVSEPLRLLRDHEKRTGEKLSFTAYVIRCVAKAVDEHREVAGYRKGGKGVVIFDDVDVGALIEREFEGRGRHPTMHFLMSANSKSFRRIHDELREAQGAPVDPNDLTERRRTRFLALPRFLRRLMLRTMRRDPFARKHASGTVGVTAVGMLGPRNHRGWAIPISLWSLTVTLGETFRAPAVGPDDRIEPRDFLALTISVDHDVVDGGPAARFSARLCELLEAGFELPGGPADVDAV